MNAIKVKHQYPWRVMVGVNDNYNTGIVKRYELWRERVTSSDTRDLKRKSEPLQTRSSKEVWSARLNKSYRVIFEWLDKNNSSHRFN